MWKTNPNGRVSIISLNMPFTAVLSHREKTTRPGLHQLCEVLAPIARTALLQYFAPNCCIATCKILRDVFAYYGYRAREVPVTVMIYNAAMQRLVEQGIAFPDDNDEKRALFDRHGAWGIGIVPPRRGEVAANGFGGHLVLNVEGMLVDGSLQQAERVERQIVIPSLLWFTPMPNNFFALRAKGQHTSGMLNDCVVVYKRLDNEGYRVSPNWRQEHAGAPAAYRTILTLASVALATARRQAAATAR
jgi:hypothetical protein